MSTGNLGGLLAAVYAFATSYSERHSEGVCTGYLLRGVVSSLMDPMFPDANAWRSPVSVDGFGKVNSALRELHHYLSPSLQPIYHLGVSDERLVSSAIINWSRRRPPPVFEFPPVRLARKPIDPKLELRHLCRLPYRLE